MPNHTELQGLLGDLNPLNMRVTIYTPKGTSLSQRTSHKHNLVTIHLSVRPVDWAKKTEKGMEIKQTVANWPFAQTTHVAGSKSNCACLVAYSVQL